MDFDHLRYFQTLAACGSYTAAAKQLFISQPALSYAISQLEARTEIKLFERTARGVRLTPAGEEYLKHVDRAIEELDIGKARARTIAGGASIVRISLMRVLGAIFLPNAITRFKQAFPDEECKFDLRLGIASEVAADIEEGRSGIGLCSRVGNEELKHIAVAKQKLVVIAPRDHELARKDSVNLIEAARYPQVGFAPGTGLRQTVDKMFSDAGVSVPTFPRSARTIRSPAWWLPASASRSCHGSPYSTSSMCAALKSRTRTTTARSTWYTPKTRRSPARRSDSSSSRRWKSPSAASQTQR